MPPNGLMIRGRLDCVIPSAMHAMYGGTEWLQLLFDPLDPSVPKLHLTFLTQSPKVRVVLGPTLDNTPDMISHTGPINPKHCKCVKVFMDTMAKNRVIVTHMLNTAYSRFAALWQKRVPPRDSEGPPSVWQWLLPLWSLPP